jgi:hypothetical protein
VDATWTELFLEMLRRRAQTSFPRRRTLLLAMFSMMLL